MKTNKGFFLLELLLSLAAWLILCLFLLPIVSDLEHQMLRLEVDKMARQFLFEELEAYLSDEQSAKNHSEIHKTIEYKIIWKEIDGGLKEVCVQVENPLSQTKICSTPE